MPKALVGGDTVPSEKGREPETDLAAGRKPRAEGKKCWDPHRVFVFLAASAARPDQLGK